MAVYIKTPKKEISMKLTNIFINALIFVLVLSVSGIAAAQDEQEMTNQQYCEKEAKEAGMTDDQDVKEYVSQCLAEINSNAGSTEKAESES